MAGDVRMTNNQRIALVEAQRFIRARTEETGYGFHRPANPHDFTPDADQCNEKELAAHGAACKAYDAGTYQHVASSESITDDAGVEVIHLLRAPWGIGTYTYRDPHAAAVLEKIDLALREAGHGS